MFALLRTGHRFSVAKQTLGGVTVFVGTGVLGAVLIIDTISRHCDDVYECEATNGVPPSVTRQMRVTVECM